MTSMAGMILSVEPTFLITLIMMTSKTTKVTAQMLA